MAGGNKLTLGVGAVREANEDPNENDGCPAGKAMVALEEATQLTISGTRH